MSWIERAYVGQKVVFVRWFEERPLVGEITPTLNSIYTIREIILDDDGGVGIRLVEIINAKREYSDGYEEVCFDANKFRPVKDTTHQVEALKRLCNPTPEVVA